MIGFSKETKNRKKIRPSRHVDSEVGVRPSGFESHGLRFYIFLRVICRASVGWALFLDLNTLFFRRIIDFLSVMEFVFRLKLYASP